MPAAELLCSLLGVSPSHLTSQENLILEAELFIHICEELKEIFNKNNKDYFLPINMEIQKEDIMLEASFLRFVINDILLSEDYSLSGIAYYTQIPEDIICDVVAGRNNSPSLQLSRKIIDLHRSVRPNLYKDVIKKIAVKYLTVE